MQQIPQFRVKLKYAKTIKLNALLLQHSFVFAYLAASSIILLALQIRRTDNSVTFSSRPGAASLRNAAEKNHQNVTIKFLLAHSSVEIYNIMRCKTINTIIK